MYHTISTSSLKTITSSLMKAGLLGQFSVLGSNVINSSKTQSIGRVEPTGAARERILSAHEGIGFSSVHSK